MKQIKIKIKAFGKQNTVLDLDNLLLKIIEYINLKEKVVYEIEKLSKQKEITAKLEIVDQFDYLEIFSMIDVLLESITDCHNTALIVKVEIDDLSSNNKFVREFNCQTEYRKDNRIDNKSLSNDIKIIENPAIPYPDPSGVVISGQKMTNLISQYSKYLGLITAVCYLVGFIIVNSFLPNSFLNYGIVNAKYLSIGVLYIALLAIPICLTLISIKDEDYLTSDIPILLFTIPISYLFSLIALGYISTLFISIRILLFMLACIVASTIGLFVIIKFIKKYTLPLSIIWISITFIIFFLMFLLHDHSILNFSLWVLINTFFIGSSFVRYKKKNYGMWDVFFFIVTMTSAIYLFGSDIYENIKPSFGGGAPVNVTLSFKPDIISTGSFKALLDSTTVCDSKKLQLYDHSNGYLLIKKDSTFYHIKDEYVVMIKK